MSSLPKFYIGSLDKYSEPVFIFNSDNGLSVFTMSVDTCFILIDKPAGQFAIRIVKPEPNCDAERVQISYDTRDEAEQDLVSLKKMMFNHYGWSEPEPDDTQKEFKKLRERDVDHEFIETQDLFREIDKGVSEPEFVDTLSLPKKTSRRRRRVWNTAIVAASVVLLALIGTLTINLKASEKKSAFLINTSTSKAVDTSFVTPDVVKKEAEPITSGISLKTPLQVNPVQLADNSKTPAPAPAVKPARVNYNPDFIKISALPPAQYSWGFGNPKGKPLYVFSDPMCSACQDFTAQLRAIEKDYFIHVYPVDVIDGARSDEIIQNMACSSNPPKAWDDWMGSRILNTAIELRKECSEPALTVTKFNTREFLSNHFSGTPTMIREDGAVLKGTLPDNEFKTWLEATGSQPAKNNAVAVNTDEAESYNKACGE